MVVASDAGSYCCFSCLFLVVYFSVQSTLRIIDDHRTLMQDLLATGQDLIDICGEDDGHDIRVDLQETMYKYSDIKAIARQKMNILKDKLRSSTQEVRKLRFLTLEVRKLRSSTLEVIHPGPLV